MCGETCLVGVTSVEAWNILQEAPPAVEITVSRKKESLALNFRGSNSDLTATPGADVQLPPSRTRLSSASSSLHFTSITPSTSFQSGLQEGSSTEDLREETTAGYLLTPPTQPLPAHEETFMIVLHRSENKPFGFSVKGGVDRPELPRVHVRSSLMLVVK